MTERRTPGRDTYHVQNAAGKSQTPWLPGFEKQLSKSGFELVRGRPVRRCCGFYFVSKTEMWMIVRKRFFVGASRL
jgi:hypothetical protein